MLRVFALGLFLFSQATALDLPPAPKYIYPATNGIEIERSFDKYVTPDWGGLIFDTHYIGVEYKYFNKFNKWFQAELSKIEIPDDGEAFDCEDYALLYKSLFGMAAFKESNLRQIAVGVIIVDQKKEALGIPAVGSHALNIILTDKGWIVYEPQTNKSCKLSAYPNKITSYII